ncbi:hypothetical protein LWI29_005283 [Acer saccharum]|uniref:Cytochrome P450 n=1 Tax=Acer saccharum TaxID=4024 RepID=A0AA39SJA3_ACESA|nr:hypothetical protein LWI29_005283 [Acer saccharum]
MHRIQEFRIDVARKHKTYRFPGFLGSTSQVLTVDPGRTTSGGGGIDFRGIPTRTRLGESGRFHPESPFKFTTFQAGPRICLGKEFAYRQMKIFCMILLASYVFKLSDENEEVKYDQVSLYI